MTSNYTDVLLSGSFWRQVFNSVLIAVIATVLVVGCGTAKILAFTALSMLPALTFFLLAERRIVGGLTGSVKG